VLLLDWFPIGQRCSWERGFGTSRFVVMKKLVAIEQWFRNPLESQTPFVNGKDSYPPGKQPECDRRRRLTPHQGLIQRPAYLLRPGCARPESPDNDLRPVASRWWRSWSSSAWRRPRHHLFAYDTAYSQLAGQLGCFTPAPRRCPTPSIQCRDVFEQIEDVGPFDGRHSLVLHGWSADDVG
jgi:hypothetical protein